MNGIAARTLELPDVTDASEDDDLYADAAALLLPVQVVQIADPFAKPKPLTRPDDDEEEYVEVDFAPEL